MQESSLHAMLKDLYTKEGDQKEVFVDGYLIDVISGDLLIEIQTRNFSAIKRKITVLLQQYPLRLVSTIPVEKWILYLPLLKNNPIQRRKSPSHGRIEDIFKELIRIPELLKHPNFSMEILTTREEEIRRNDGRGSWRRKGVSIIDHRLIEIVGRSLFTTPGDFLTLLPDTLPQPFTNLDLANSLRISRNLATKMSYCLRKMEVLSIQGRCGGCFLYSREC